MLKGNTVDENEDQELDDYGYPLPIKCDIGCGGYMSWCSCCECYTNNCCVDYGTCMCS